MKILDVLKTDFQRIRAFLIVKEPAFISGIQQAVNLTSAFLAWKQTPGGVTAEAIVEATIPKGKAWSDDVTKIATAMVTDLAACSNPASWKGIALRLGAEILSIIDGGKLPTGIDGYLAEIQNIFIG